MRNVVQVVHGFLDKYTVQPRKQEGKHRMTCCTACSPGLEELIATNLCTLSDSHITIPVLLNCEGGEKKLIFHSRFDFTSTDAL